MARKKQLENCEQNALIVHKKKTNKVREKFYSLNLVLND